MTNNAKLKKPGISGIRRFYGDDVGGPPLKKLRAGGSLTDLLNDYVLFTYAPLCLYGGLTFNPVQEWLNLDNYGQIVYILTLDIPILSMSNNLVWDYTLWAIEKEFWPSLSLHIGSLAIIDKRKKLLSRVICQELPVLDVGMIDKGIIDKSPTVLIYTFSVDSNNGCMVFEPARNCLTDKPRLVRINAREETRKLAEALFNESSNPYNSIQRMPWEK